MPTPAGRAADLTPGTVKGAGPWAVGNAQGERFAVSRRCRHLLGDLGAGTIDRKGCLVCPNHGARYDTTTGRMVKGPQGVYAKIPFLDSFFEALTKVIPLRRGTVVEEDGELTVG